MTGGANALPGAHGGPVLSATMRSAPEDFFVEELDAFPASGEGEHLLLTVEKRGMNTAFAARRIAAWAGVPESAIGYAGLKDRHALTRQRFSAWLPARRLPDVAALQAEDLRVLGHAWHARKMPRGALAGNRFVISLRDVEGDRAAIESRLQAVADAGVPNYFGEQRFGREGGNVEAALSMFAGRRVRRAERSLLLSAARAELFNLVLARRVSEASWNQPLDGEVWMLDGSRSVFGPEAWSDALQQRLQAFDIHPTAPLWGKGELRSTGESRSLELSAIEGERGQALRAGLEQAGLRQERRATRLRPANLTWSWEDARTLQVGFELPPGAYATTMLAELGEPRGPDARPAITHRPSG